MINPPSHYPAREERRPNPIRPIARLVLLLIVAASPCAKIWAESKVFMLNGETRVGFVHCRDGRITVRAEDRLFQSPTDAVHRIDHVTGETALVSGQDVLLREKPERLSKNLIAVPKGCEVQVLERNEDWAKIEVYGGRSKAVGHIHVDDLSDSVFFHNIDPRVRFKRPPPSLKNRFNLGHETPKSGLSGVRELIDLDLANETGFNQVLLERLYGGDLDSLRLQQEQMEAGKKKSTAIQEEAEREAQQPGEVAAPTDEAESK